MLKNCGVESSPELLHINFPVREELNVSILPRNSLMMNCQGTESLLRKQSRAATVSQKIVDIIPFICKNVFVIFFN